MKFFKAKAVEAKKTDAAESKAERDALIAKINSIAKNIVFRSTLERMVFLS